MHTYQDKETKIPPFKVLFGNDTTNITTCIGPYHVKGEDFKESMIRATVQETSGTGVDVQLIQPGTIWLPWWKSNIYSMKEHYSWFEKRYGIKPDSNVFNEFVFNGGDVVEVFIDECVKQKITPFISVRLNDGHFLETWNDDPPKGDAPAHCLSKFYVEHVPEYCVGYGYGGEIDFKNWDHRVQNWAVPEVREYKYRLIEELCKNYDLEGIELDFMRHRSHFNLDQTTAEQRCRIMAHFVRRVRNLLDKTAHGGKKRWLCVRIPCYMSLFDRSGIDVKLFAAAGVDMFNLSPFYFTVCDADVEKVCKLVGEGAVYLEMCHTTYVGKSVAKGYDNFTFRRTTPIQYYTAAYLAYSRGAYGISTFNFVYYREHGNGERGPFNEPPFEVFENIDDFDWLSKQPQHYVLANTWLSKYSDNKMPFKYKHKGDSYSFTMDTVPVKGGWKEEWQA